MAAAKPFLERLEQLGMLDEKILAQLRQQVVDAKGPVTAETLAKVLVENGHLTVFQAKKIISDLTAPPEEAKPVPSAAPITAKPVVKKPMEEDLTLADDEDGLTLLEDAPPAPVAKATSKVAPQPVAKAIPIPKPAEKKNAASVTPPPKATTKKWTTPKSAKAQAATDDLEILPDDVSPIELGTEDLLGGSSLESASALEASSPLLGPKKPSGGVASLLGGGSRAKSKNPWDSSLIYVGGGGLAILVFAFVLLYFALARGTASEAFQLAEADYQGQAYGEAITKYEKFATRYSDDENASLARVRIGMSQIHLALADGRNWPRILDATKESLKQIEMEEKFDEARAELAEILPRIAEALALEARRSTSDIPKAKEYVEHCEEALQLVNNGANIPPHLRAPVETKVAAILENVTFVKREINRDTELNLALTGIGEAVSSGKTVEAYEIRRQLLKKYPGLDVNAQLVAATPTITQKQRELARVQSQTIEPQAATAQPWTEFVLADRTAPASSTASGSSVAITASGSVYGVDAGSGSLLWRQVVGAGCTTQPVAVEDKPTTDWLVSDERTQALLRLESKSGKALWRLPIGERFFAPTVVGPRAIVTTAAGRLIDVDLATGQSQRQAILPQAAAQSCGYDTRRQKLYQLGDHSNLYVLSAETLACEEVYFIGHEAGAIAVPPVAISGQLFIADNAGAASARIHLLSADAEGLKIERKQERSDLQGNIVSPSVVDGRRVYFFTNLGVVQVYDVDPANITQPISVVAKLGQSRSEPLISFAAAAESKAWVADERLTQYDLQPARGDLARRWSQFDGDTFIVPPIRRGTTLVHARIRRQFGDLAIAASNSADGKPLWQTTLGVPVSTVMKVDNGLQAWNAQGAAFSLARPGVTEAPLARVGNPPRSTWQVPLAPNSFAFLDREANAQWVLAHAGATPKATLMKYGGEAAKLSTAGVAFEGGLALPLASGHIALVDPASGKPLVFPFLPRLEATTTPTWRALIAIPGARPMLAAADDRQQLYLLARKEMPQPHLAGLKPVDVGGPIGEELAVYEGQLVAVVKRDAEHVLQGFGLPDLMPGTALALSSAVAWGPATANDALFVVTDRDGLICIGSGLAERWKVPLDGANLVGLPLAIGADYVVANTRGEVLLVAGDQGQVKQRMATGLALGGSPVNIDGTLYLPGVDGAVYALPLTALTAGSTP